MSQHDRAPQNAEDVRAQVHSALLEHIEHQRTVLADLGPATTDLVDAVQGLLASGKRLRAAFLYWSYRGAGGTHHTAAIRAGAAMELFQGAALLHDDVMDDSDLRRGRPTAHRTFASHHSNARWSGNSERFGHAAAILAGDLCLTWSDQLFSTAGFPTVEMERARPTFDVMRTQLMGGQFLDVLESAQGWDGMSHRQRIAQCLRVITYKSAKYSVQQPLLIGAAAAGAGPQVLEALAGYGLELGIAFQLRDDVLGVFGDPDSTGKPAGDDITEGKRTVLIAHALDAGTAAQRALVLECLGAPELSDDQIAAVRDVLVATGAVERTEEMIAAGAARALDSLAPALPQLTDEGATALQALVASSTERTT